MRKTTANAFAQYVKDNFATFKKNNPGIAQKEIMAKLSEQYKKKTGKTEEEVTL